MGRKVKDNSKGAKAMADYGIKPVNEECKTCIYYAKKNTCKGRFNQFVPCVFAPISRVESIKY